MRPCAGYITQHFGENPAFYVDQGYTGHPGIDFSTDGVVGARIVQSHAGQIVFVGHDPQFPGRGLHFWRDNLDGTRTLGAHLLSCSLTVGQLVHQGDFAALSGDSGLNIFTSTAAVQVAPHYHEGRAVLHLADDPNRGFVDFEDKLP